MAVQVPAPNELSLAPSPVPMPVSVDTRPPVQLSHSEALPTGVGSELLSALPSADIHTVDLADGTRLRFWSGPEDCFDDASHGTHITRNAKTTGDAYCGQGDGPKQRGPANIRAFDGRLFVQVDNADNETNCTNAWFSPDGSRYVLEKITPANLARNITDERVICRTEGADGVSRVLGGVALICLALVLVDHYRTEGRRPLALHL